MAEKSSRPIVPGLILIVLGFLFLLSNFGAFDFDWGVLWTWLVILIGVIFWLGFLLDREKYGLIMPGTILLTLGIVFNISARYYWADMEDLWPFFILAPAFGFYAMYFLGRREAGLLVPAGILTVIGLIFLMQSYTALRYIWPLAMIAAGVLILVRPGSGKHPARGGGDGGGDRGGRAAGTGGGTTGGGTGPAGSEGSGKEGSL